MSTKVVVTRPSLWNEEITMTNTVSLCQILGIEEQMIQYDAIASEDHSYVATRQERNRNGKYWKTSLNKEGIQGPMNQEKETNQSSLHNKSGNGLINNLKASKKTNTDLNLAQDGDSTLPPGRRIHLRHRTGSRAATGRQIEAGIRGKHHPGLNSIFLLRSEMSFRLSEI